MAGPQTTTPSQKGRQYRIACETTALLTPTTPKGKMAGSRVMKRQSQTAMAKRQKFPATASLCGPSSRQKNLGALLAARILSDMYSGNFINFLHLGRQGVAAQDPSDLDLKARTSPLRGNPCAFRTMLNDGASSRDSIANSTYDDMGNDSIRFDDSECISIGRTLGNVSNQQQQLQKRVDSGIALETQGRNLYSVPADLLDPGNEDDDESAENNSRVEEDVEMAICSPIFTTEHRPFDFSVKADDEIVDVIHSLAPITNNLSSISGFDNQELDSMEAMNMPFWNGTPRQKRHQRFPFRDHDAANDEDDDMSIVSDLSLIPSYSPGDIDRQFNVKITRAVFKRLIKSQAKAASKTVRQIKRTCREAMEHALTIQPLPTSRRPVFGLGMPFEQLGK